MAVERMYQRTELMELILVCKPIRILQYSAAYL